MKKLFLIISLVTVASTVFGQSKPEDEQRKELLKRTVSQQAAGNLEGAIDSAEKLLELERKSSNQNSCLFRSALLNVARLRRDRMIDLREKAGGKGPLLRERTEFSKTAAANAEESEKYYREAISLPQSDASESEAVSEAMAELAWLMHNYFPSNDSPTVAGSRSRIDQAESLYADALKLSEGSAGNDAEKTMLIVLSFGNFYQKFDNYEKSMALYERYVATVERTKGKTDADLPNALRPLAQILHATFQETESDAVIKRIESITRRKEDLPLGKLGLHLRSKDSVAFHLEASEAVRTKAKYAESSSTARLPRVVGVVVRVTVDENGKVIEAVAETDDSALKRRAEKEIATWIVRPYTYGGIGRKLRGQLSYRESY